jgi:hypothetical protein
MFDLDDDGKMVDKNPLADLLDDEPRRLPLGVKPRTRGAVGGVMKTLILTDAEQKIIVHALLHYLSDAHIDDTEATDVGNLRARVELLEEQS